MLQFLRRLFRRERGRVTSNMLALKCGNSIHTVTAISRIGYALRVRWAAGHESIVTRKDACHVRDFDRILATYPRITEPMFTEDGEEVDHREFF